jgi:exopolyphosphatase/guanosine-5'-triphosphate,3'-diphosphate pyrophosphatase
MSHRRNLAAIDIGTSSVHLAIARPIEGGRPEILLREKLPVRLGSGVSDMKTLDPDAVDRTIEALSTFRALAAAHDAEIHAVATSAVREADDASEFLNRARDEAGIDVEVIVGVEEARLIHLGVLGAVPIADTRHLVIDIGGGSTELIVGEGVEPTYLRSLKIGHVRLSNRFFPDGLATNERIDQCRRFIRSFIARDAVTIRSANVEVVVGCSGTFETLAAVARNGRRVTTGDEQRHSIRRDDDQRGPHTRRTPCD